MLKRIGVLALMLSGGAMFLAPTAALAAEHRDRGNSRVEIRHDADRGRQEYRDVRRDDHNRWAPAPRVYYAPAPNYYYVPAPNCTYPN